MTLLDFVVLARADNISWETEKILSFSENLGSFVTQNIDIIVLLNWLIQTNYLRCGRGGGVERNF